MVLIYNKKIGTRPDVYNYVVLSRLSRSAPRAYRCTKAIKPSSIGSKQDSKIPFKWARLSPPLKVVAVLFSLITGGERKRPSKPVTATAASSRVSARRNHDQPGGSCARDVSARAMELLESLAMQTMLYMAFVLIFQMLANSLRDPQEYHVDIRLMEDFVQENFDSSHNTFESIRRFADVYEWGNQVLWPSLFANIEPCNPASVGSRATPKTCNDLTWPDGEGAFGSQGASSFNVSELVRQMDILDWTEGVFIRQMRAAPVPCHSASQLERQSAEELIAAGFLQPLTDAQGNEVVPLFTGANAAIEYATEVKACYPELEPGGSSNVSFGYNGTHPTLPMWEPWEHFSASELGQPEPGSVRSAAIPSMAQYDASGYALAIPFFSDTWMRRARPCRERHRLSEVRSQHDQRQSRATASAPRTMAGACASSVTQLTTRATKRPADGRSAAGGGGDVERPQARPLSTRARDSCPLRFSSSQTTWASGRGCR